eukprot:444215_1
MAASENDVALEVVKQSVRSTDTPQQQYQYIASKLGTPKSDKTDSMSDDYLCLPQASAMQNKPHIITNYANKPHADPSKDNDDTSCAKCSVYEQQITKLSHQNSDSNRQSEDTQDDDLKDWVLPIEENTTMQQAMECIGDKQLTISKLQTTVHDLTRQLNIITQEKASLTAANQKFHEMYTIQKHQFEALQQAYQTLKQRDDAVQKQYAETSTALKQYKRKNNMLQQQIQNEDHSKCHELIKQHYNKCKMFEYKYKDLLKETNPILIQQNKEIVHKYNALLVKYSEVSRKYNDYIEENNTKMNNTDDLVNETLSLKQQIKDLMTQNDTLLDDQKEHETTMHDLRSEISKLKLNSMDTTNYVNWKHKDILMWIMSLDNNRLGQYHDHLLQSLKEEGIEGIHLNEVNETDIKGWGVKNFADKKFLLKKIKQLVNQNKNVNRNYVLNEGAPTA